MAKKGLGLGKVLTKIGAFKKKSKSLKRIRGVESKYTESRISSGCLAATSALRLRPESVESARRVIRRSLAKQGAVRIGVYPDLTVSEKPKGVRMGKGKGQPKYVANCVKKGRILFEIEDLDKVFLAKRAFDKAKKKLPLKSSVFFL